MAGRSSALDVSCRLRRRLNAVEGFLSTITRRKIRRDVFAGGFTRPPVVSEGHAILPTSPLRTTCRGGMPLGRHQIGGRARVASVRAISRASRSASRAMSSSRSAAASPGGTSQPARHPSMISGIPPQLLAITGTFNARVSSTTKPKASQSEGTTASSARATMARASLRDSSPKDARALQQATHFA
jgi:hypothetical protein